ncbi:MAG: transporter substrate-binding domain-containing protein [Cyanobacteria bacterium J06627_32]
MIAKRRYKTRRSVFIVGLVVAFLMILASCTTPTAQNGASTATESALTQVADEGNLKVGYLVFPPAITKDPSSGELGGHLVTAIEEIARLNDWTIEFIETDWAAFSTGLDSQRFDISIVPTFITIPRALSVYFTDPLFYAGNSAISRTEETRFTDLESIDQPGVKVAVTQGEAGDEYASANFTNAEIVRFSGSDQSLTFQSVVSGRADIALGDAYVTSEFAEENPQVKDLFADNPYNLTPVSWGVRKGDDEMLNFANSSLQVFEQQGKLQEWEREAGANWLHVKQVLELTR